MVLPIQQSIHLVMQSKGGVGKSVVASMLSQYLINALDREDVHIVDLDPNNKTLSAYEQLQTERVNIINPDDHTVDQKCFDGFLEGFLNKSQTYVVDTGSGEYLELVSYLELSSVPDIIQGADRPMYIHVPVVYGQAEVDTKKCLMSLAAKYPTVKIIAWENEYFGRGSTLLEQTSLLENFSNIVGVVKIAKQPADTFEQDFKDMIKAGMTFNEVRNGKEFGLFSKTRLNRIEKDITAELDMIFGSTPSIDTPVEAPKPSTKTTTKTETSV